MALAGKKILVTRILQGNWEKRLKEAGLSVMVPCREDRKLTREEFLSALPGSHAVLGMLTEKWDREAFHAAGADLKMIANYAVGFNNIDLEEATRRGIQITNTPDVLTAATADTAWALLMAAARRVAESDRFVRAGKFHGWGPNDWIGLDLEGKTLGILGAGRIGSTIARRSRGWDMNVIYHHPTGKADFEKETGAQLVSFEELLKTSDYLSISVPLNDQTHHMIGAEELAAMKPTSVLINTARGPVIDEAALVKALRDRTIFAAGLDVYENEPTLAEGLATLDNVLLLPHLGSATVETRSSMVDLAVTNALAVLRGEQPPNPVNTIR